MLEDRPQLMMIGLDGATFDVIRPLIAMGKLPHLSRLMDVGAHGTLTSIIPPITGPAWSVLATGKNPGQLGVYDFINRRSRDDYKLYPIRSNAFAGQSFWDVLNGQGYRIGILNYPMLVPAYEINGWMVAGLGASKLHDFTYPSHLKRKLDEVTGGYEINISYGLPKYKDNLPRLVADMKTSLRNRLLVLDEQLRSDPVDVLVVVLSISDVASHTLWKYWDIDVQSDKLDSYQQEMRDSYISIWEELDQAVGKILSYLDPKGHALLVSDHGFGSSYGVFHTNQWLHQEGYLVRKQEKSSGGNQLREWLIEKTNPILGPIFKKMVGSKAHQLLRASILREIDLSHSKAFALDNSDLCGGIYINRQYARSRGLNEEDFVHETCLQLKQELEAFGASIELNIQVFIASKIYFGDKADLAPEIMVVIDDYRGSVSHRFDEPIYTNRSHHPMKSGTHRENGILIATGPRILNGEIRDAQLQDIAPTLLHLIDAPIPASTDGRVLTEMLGVEHRVVDNEHSLPVDWQSSPVALKDEEDEGMDKMRDRLVALGYLEKD